MDGEDVSESNFPGTSPRTGPAGGGQLARIGRSELLWLSPRIYQRHYRRGRDGPYAWSLKHSELDYVAKVQSQRMAFLRIWLVAHWRNLSVGQYRSLAEAPLAGDGGIGLNPAHAEELALARYSPPGISCTALQLMFESRGS